MLEELMNAHIVELKASARTIEHRSAWAQISRLERLERALTSARSRMRVLPNLSARTN